MNPTELAALIVLGGSIAAYAVGGAMHIAIDYVHGKRLLKKYWDATDVKIAAIKGEVIEALEDEEDEGSLIRKLRSEIDRRAPFGPDGPTAAGFESFLRSEAGKQWSVELADVTGTRVTEAIVTRLRQKAGAVAHHDQSRIARALAENMRFDVPVLDGAWGFLDPQTKMKIVNRLAKVIRRAGVENMIAEIEAGEVGEQLELPSGSESDGRLFG